MRILKTGMLCVLLHVFALSSAAQNNFPLAEPDYNKPTLFDDLPTKFPVDVKLLESLLDLPEGQTLSVPLAKGVRFQGTVISKSDPYDPNVKSIVIKSTNRIGSAFIFKRLRNEDGSFSYQGRILSKKHSDAFEIQLEEGQYVLTKTQLLDLISE
jgi:hypothetical protein